MGRLSNLTEEMILDELTRIAEAGYRITQKQLLELRRSDLLNQLRKFGSLTSFKEKLGLKLFRQTWTEGKIIEEYIKICNERGDAPSVNELCRLGYGGLASAIKKNFRSLHDFYKKAKVPPKKMERYYWTIMNTITALKAFINENRNLIERTSFSYALRKNRKNYSSLEHAVCEWGGIEKLNNRYKLGLKIHKGLTERQLIKELKKLKESGINITQKVLKDLNRQDLLAAIAKFGTLTKYKEKLGLQVNRYRYWTEELIFSELWKLIKIYKFLPSLEMLKVIGRGDLQRAIHKKGGMQHFAKQLNMKPQRYYVSDNGNWLHSSYELLFENTLIKYNIPFESQVKICKEYKYSADYYIQGIFIEITGYNPEDNPEYFSNLDKKIKLYKENELSYHIIPKRTFYRNKQISEGRVLGILNKLFPEFMGGISDKLPLAISNTKKFGHFVNSSPIDKRSKSILKRKAELPGKKILPIEHWADIENVKKVLLPLVGKYGGMPTDTQFRKEGMSSLINGIYTHFENFYELGKRLNIPVRSKPKNYYTEETVLFEYKKLCIRQKKFLTIKELYQLGHSGLASVIGNFYKIYRLREKTGLDFPQIRQPYFSYDRKKAVEEYNDFCVQHSSLLTKKDLYSMGKKSLANFIMVNIGFNKIRQLAGLDKHPLFKTNQYTEKEVIEAYKRICSEHRWLLTYKELCSVDRDLAKFIRSEIGMKKIKFLSKLSLPPKKKEKAFDESSAKARYSALCKEQRYLLTRKCLVHLDERGLSGFIGREIGFRKIQKEIGPQLLLKDKRQILVEGASNLKWGNAIREYTQLCSIKDHFLGAQELKSLGYAYLDEVIRRHGGYYRLIEQIDLPFYRRPPRTVLALDRIAAEYKRVCLAKGVFLCSKELIELGYAKLDVEIQHSCRYKKIRKLTGLDFLVRKKVRKKELTIKLAVDMFKKLSIKKGQFASKNDFLELGNKKLAWFIQNNGGYRGFQRLSRLAPQKFHKINQSPW